MNARRIAANEKNKISVENFDLPLPLPDEVLVETLYTAISTGTEVARIQNITNPPTKFPYYPGYSACCRVIEKGREVKTIEVGQIVVCQTPHASHWVTKAEKCFLLPEGVSEVEGAVIRLGTISLRGVRKADIKAGWNVAVVGLGPIGFLAALLARYAGAAHIAGIDRQQWKCDLAKECGINKVATSFEAANLDGNIDVILEATGNPETIPAVLRLAKKSGRVVLLGSHRGVTSQVDFYNTVHKKGLTIIGVHDSTRSNSLHTDVDAIFKLILQRGLNLKPLIKDAIHYEESEKTYEHLINKTGNNLIAVLSWK